MIPNDVDSHHEVKMDQIKLKHLSKSITLDDTKLNIEKTYYFPKHVLYKAFTQDKYFRKWWGPYDSEITNCKINLQIGGELMIELNGKNGTRQFEGMYKEILENEKLVFSLSVIERGTSVFETITTILFEEPEPDVTNLSLSIQVIKSKSEIAHLAIKGMKDGWYDALEKLNVSLIEIKP